MDEQVFHSWQRDAGTWVRRGRLRLMRHLIERHAPGTTPDILELGAADGPNLAVLSALAGGPVDVAETSERARRLLAADHRVRRCMAIGDSGSWDIIVALEVLEHLDDDRQALRWCLDSLKPGGLVVATVPAHPWLWSDHDVALGHRRRYTRARLADAVPPEAAVLELGWYVGALMPAAVLARGLWRWKGQGRQPKPAATSTIDRICGNIFDAELALIERGVRLPVGYGLFMVLRR